MRSLLDLTTTERSFLKCSAIIVATFKKVALSHQLNSVSNIYWKCHWFSHLHSQMTGVKKHLGGITRLKIKTDQKWWKHNIGIWASLGKCLMYTTNLLKVRHLRETVVNNQRKICSANVCASFALTLRAGLPRVSQSWFGVPVQCQSQPQDAEQNTRWVPWSGEGSVVPNTPSRSVSVRDPLPHTRLAPQRSRWSLLRNGGSKPSAKW